MGRRKRKDKQNRAKWFFCLVLLMVLSVYTIVYTERIIKPNLTAIAEIKTRAMIAQAINEAVQSQLASDAAASELLLVQTGQDGKIAYVQSNSVAMTRLSTGVVSTLQQQYREMEPTKVTVPIGSLLGSQILSEFGPKIEIRVLPIGMSKVNFKTEFESAGINQTKYKVFLELDSQARILIPFSAEDIRVENSILIAEAIIVGEVPESYINVPKEDTLDATDIMTNRH